MTEPRKNIVVGVFALVGVLIVGVLVFVFGGGRSLFTKAYNVTVVFPKGVVGIQSGQGVTLNGKRIGETAAVDFPRDKATGVMRTDQGINVVVSVDQRYDLPSATKVIVVSSVMGFGRPAIQFVVTEPGGKSLLPKDGSAQIQGEMMPVLDQLLPRPMQVTMEKTVRDIGELAAALKPAAENLGHILESRNIQQVDVEKATANLTTVIERFDVTLRNVNEILGNPENQANFKQTLANARQMSESGITLMRNLNDMSQDGKQAVANVNVLSQRLIGATDEMSSVLKRMDQALVMMNEGQGTAGLLLRDNRLYEELVITTRRMTAALDDFREVLDMAKKGKLKLF